MPWYKQGTVSVTQGQNAVVGTGTDFVANSRVGDAFRGPDGAWYEVVNVVSPTLIAIYPVYQGANQPTGSYALAPMQGYVKESADRLRQLVEQFGGTLAVFGGATDAATLRANISAATRGANSDITSLAGLTTALSIAQGGTGSTTAAGARTALGLKSAALADIVGTVSQSSGVPTGAIIEKGSNASGRYTKFADGTMICSSKLTYEQAVTFAQDGMFIGATPTFGFPVAFSEAPAITFSCRAQTVFTQPNNATTTTYQGLVMSLTSRTITAEFIMTAQGRWF